MSENEHEQQPYTGDDQEANINTDKESKHFGPITHFMRFAICIAAGLAIFIVAVTAAWQASRMDMGYHTGQFPTRCGLKNISQAIKRFQDKNNRIPNTLAELVANEEIFWRILDGWDRPYIYSIEGDQYQLLSYGRDGKPGGVGLDCDLSSDNPQPAQSQITLNQYLSMMSSHKDPGYHTDAYSHYVRKTIVICIIAGVCAFFVCLKTIKPIDISLPGIAQIVGKIISVAVCAVIIAVVVTLLHYPSGH